MSRAIGKPSKSCEGGFRGVNLNLLGVGLEVEEEGALGWVWESR